MANGTLSSASAVARGDRVPPHSEEAERGVLGSVLLDASRVMDLCIQQQLVPESFYIPAHRTIYRAMAEMSMKGQVIDLLTVTNKLQSSNEIDLVGGPIALDRLVDATPTAAHAEYYIDIVRQKHLLRCIIDRAREAENICYKQEENAETILGQVETAFFDISHSQHELMRPWSQVVRGVMEHIEQVHTLKKNITGISTGFMSLDNILLGLRPGNLIILAARPSMGKTSLAMNIAEHVAHGDRDPEHKARPVGIFSLEMSCEDLVMRMICSRAGVDHMAISRGYISDTNHRQLIGAANDLTKAPLYLDDAAGLDVMELRARARRMKKKYNIELIVVDYLQLLHCREDAKQGRQVEIASVSGHLKAMAKELRVPVLVLSQLSRAPEARDQNKPKLADLRDSGAIEQDADVVLMLRRPCRIDGDADAADQTLAIVDVAKHRNGPAGEEIRMNFIATITRFQDRVELDHAAGITQEEALE